MKKFIIALVVVIFFFHIGAANAQYENHPDYQPLMDIYNANTGQSSFNWSASLPLEDWYGVTMTNGRVSKLSIHSFYGILPASITNLTELEELIFDYGVNIQNLTISLSGFTKLHTLVLTGNTFMNCHYGGSSSITLPISLKKLELSFASSPFPCLKDEIVKLTQLEELHLHSIGIGAEVTGVGKMSLPSDFADWPLLNNPDGVLRLENNFLSFEDLYPLVGKPIMNSANLFYAPQNSKFRTYLQGVSNPESETPWGGFTPIGTSKTFELYRIEDFVPIPGQSDNAPGSIYEWQINYTPIPNANAISYTVGSMTINDVGFYNCKITNPNLPLLTIQTNQLSLRTDYCSSNTINWRIGGDVYFDYPPFLGSKDGSYIETYVTIPLDNTLDPYRGLSVQALQKIPAGKDGWVEILIDHPIFPDGTGYSIYLGGETINYSVLDNVATINIYSGYTSDPPQEQLQSVVGIPVQEGDRFKIARQNGQFIYYKNDKLLYTSKIGFTYNEELILGAAVSNHVRSGKISFSHTCPELSIQSQINQRFCEDSKQSIQIQVTGGGGNYSYLWSDGGTGNSRNNLTPNVYYVDVTDASGNTQRAYYDLTSGMRWQEMLGIYYENGHTYSNDLSARAIGGNKIPAYQDGWVEIELTDESIFQNSLSYGVVGLVFPVGDIKWGGEIRLPNFLQYDDKVGDIYRLSREGSQFKIYKNGAFVTELDIRDLGIPSPGEANSVDLYPVVYYLMGGIKVRYSHCAPELNVQSQINQGFCAASKQSIQLQVSGGTNDYSYLWSDGNTQKDRSNLTPNIYSVVVKDNQTGSSQQHTYELTNRIRWQAGSAGSVVSVDEISDDKDGCFSFVNNKDGSYNAGLIGSNDQEYTANNFFINVSGSNAIIYRGLTIILSISSQLNDVFVVKKKGNQILYYQNNTLVHSIVMTLPIKLKAYVHIGSYQPVIAAEFRPNCPDNNCNLPICDSSTPSSLSSNWYFGSRSSLRFSGGVVSSTTPASSIETLEGSATISDNNGNLVFYTDGTSIYNKNGVAMPVGANTNIGVGRSITQSSIIVPKPGNTNLYYVFFFTKDDPTSTARLSYVEVDMTLNNGLGGITAAGIRNLSSIGMSEKLAAIQNGNKVWLLAVDAQTLHAYEITATEVNITSKTSTLANLSNPNNYINDKIGYMKASPDGTKLAFCMPNEGKVVLANFDKTTGIASNEIKLEGSFNKLYGAEFSPDGTKLYVSKYGNTA